MVTDVNGSTDAVLSVCDFLETDVLETIMVAAISTSQDNVGGLLGSLRTLTFPMATFSTQFAVSTSNSLEERTFGSTFGMIPFPFSFPLGVRTFVRRPETAILLAVCQLLSGLLVAHKSLLEVWRALKELFHVTFEGLNRQGFNISLTGKVFYPLRIIPFLLSMGVVGDPCGFRVEFSFST